MKDRLSTKPNRFKLTLEDGTSQYVTIERADEPTEEGTLLNRASLLSASVQSLLGLTDDGTPSDALAELANRTYDTGWISLWPNNVSPYSNVKAYQDSAENAPKYRKCGNIVEVKGVVTPTAETTDRILVGRLPAGFRLKLPNIYEASRVDSTTTLRTTVYDTGTIYMACTSTGGKLTKDAWCPFQIIYTI